MQGRGWQGTSGAHGGVSEIHLRAALSSGGSLRRAEPLPAQATQGLSSFNSVNTICNLQSTIWNCTRFSVLAGLGFQFAPDKARPIVVISFYRATLASVAAGLTRSVVVLRSVSRAHKGPDGRLDRGRLETAVRYGFRIVRWNLEVEG
jgi:hypothetical protein